MEPRKKLTDILHAGDRDRLKQSWQSTQAAAEFAPLPPGEYIAHVINGELFTSGKNGTPGYKLTFKVIEGEYAGRRFWHDVWLTATAVAMAKRDLLRLGIADLDQLDQPIPPGIRCKTKLSLRKDDDGNERNRVVTFTVLGIDPRPVDPFAPSGNGEGVTTS